MQSEKQILGAYGEHATCNYLIQNGFTICATNYKRKTGEIDIIACKEQTYVFVEVKTRTNSYFALSDVITRTKQMKIIRTALLFKAEQLSKLKNPINMRFDVALIEKIPNEKLTYISNAFTADACHW